MTVHVPASNGRVQIVQRFDTFEHKVSFYVQCVDFTGACAINNHKLDDTSTLQTVANSAVTALTGMFTPTTQFIRADLQQSVFIGSVQTWETVNSVSLNAVGTGSGTNVPASQFTAIFRDIAGRVVKYAMLEGLFPLLGQNGYSGLDAAQKKFVDALLGTDVTDPQIGWYALSRSAYPIFAFSDGNFTQNSAMARKRSR